MMWPSETRWWWPLRHFLVEVCCICAMLGVGGYSVLSANRAATPSPLSDLNGGRCPEVDACRSFAAHFLMINVGASFIAAVSAGCVCAAMLYAGWRHGGIGVAAC
eukprot:COSAG02_NODE_31615_length_530_cov_1.269142_2_plen_104_part_01